MSETRFLAIMVAALLTAACAGNRLPPPKVYNLEVTPTEIDPGEPVRFRFAMDYSGAWSDITGIEVVGLPENTLAAGTLTAINVPSQKGEPAETVIYIKKPARQGIYPLQFRVLVKDSPGVVVTGVGPITVNDVIGRLDFAGFEPSSHSVGGCFGAEKIVSLKYVAYDENGANDVIRPRVTQVSPAGGLSSAPLPLILSNPADGNVIEQLVETPVRMRCKADAPQVWKWTVKASDAVGDSGQTRPTNSAVAEYFTNR